MPATDIYAAANTDTILARAVTGEALRLTRAASNAIAPWINTLPATSGTGRSGFRRDIENAQRALAAALQLLIDDEPAQ